jgi:hypothetical protein
MSGRALAERRKTTRAAADTTAPQLLNRKPADVDGGFRGLMDGCK